MVNTFTSQNRSILSQYKKLIYDRISLIFSILRGGYFWAIKIFKKNILLLLDNIFHLLTLYWQVRILAFRLNLGC